MKLRSMKEVTLPMFHSQKVVELGFRRESKAELLPNHRIAVWAFCCLLLLPLPFTSLRGLLTATDSSLAQLCP